MAEHSPLTLVDYELFSSQTNDAGEPTTVSFYVYARRGGEEPRPYLLTVMDEANYDQWFFELSHDDEPTPEPEEPVPFPLIVPVAIATEGIRNYVEGRYLDLGHPARINQIEAFLVDLVDDE